MTPASDRNETCPTWTFASAYKYLQALPRQAWKKGYRVRVLNVLSRIAQAPDTPPKWDDVWFTCFKNCGDGSLAEAKRLLSLHDAAPTPAPRCPYFSRAWGVQCDRPAGHDGNCQSGGDGFAPGYTPTTPAPREEAHGEVVETPEQEHARKADERRDAYPSLYCAMWPDLKARARSLGYALLIHGSLKRDLDLVAIPWTEDAVDARTLADAMKAVVGGWTGEVEGSTKILADKPHGRLGAIIVCGGHAAIDLSIMPTSGAALRGTGDDKKGAPHA